MTIEPLIADHVMNVLLQPSQACFASSIDAEYANRLVVSGPAFSAIHNGEVLACAGLIPQWEGRAIAWALVAAEAGPHFVRIHKAVKRFLELQKIRRIETWVYPTFEPAHRWMRLLGFKLEGRMTAYGPDGSDGDLYARLWDKLGHI
jgi:hypothetical protein